MGKEASRVVDVASAEQRALGIRLVNVEIRSMVPEHEPFDPDGWDFFCECGKCTDHVRLLAEDFDRRVAHDELVLAPGHVFVAAAEARRVAHKLRLESQAVQAQARQAVRRARQGLRQGSVLVVDDNARFQDAARSLVSAAGWLHPVGFAASGEEAIRLLPELKPDLVLLDIHMPGINGIETARIIHRQHPQIVIVLTSTETTGLTDIARSAGAAALVNKAELTPATLDAIWLKHRLRN
jgi:CheY-like chemotaxis protein